MALPYNPSMFRVPQPGRGPGRPAGAGDVFTLRAPRPAAPQMPTVPQAPIGRPRNTPPVNPGFPGGQRASYPARMEAALPAYSAGYSALGGGQRVPGGDGQPPRPAPQPAPQPVPQPVPQPAPQPAPQAQPAPFVPPVPPAPVGLPAAGPTGPAQPAAPPIATPPTAASQPIAPSPWGYEQMWGALGNLGDADIDAALKSGILGNLRTNPFGTAGLSRANAQAFEQGMAGIRGGKEAALADLARRGIQGPAAAAILAEQEASGRGAIAGAQRENVQQYAEKAAQFNQQAIAQAQIAASELANRGVNLENLRMNREQLAQQILANRAAAARAGQGEPPITIDNGDGTTSTIDPRLLEIVLGLGEGGRE